MGPGFHNGSAVTSVRSASKMKAACFIRSAMASRTRCERRDEDVNDALTGHSGGNAVARSYGWKDMVRRFGFPTLNAAVERVQYPGLDLSRLRWTPTTKSD
jgi:hypothetical protein